MRIDIEVHRYIAADVRQAFDDCEARGAVCLTDWWAEVSALDDENPEKRVAMARLAGAALWYANTLQANEDFATDGLT